MLALPKMFKWYPAQTGSMLKWSERKLLNCYWTFAVTLLLINTNNSAKSSNNYLNMWYFYIYNCFASLNTTKIELNREKEKKRKEMRGIDRRVQSVLYGVCVCLDWDKRVRSVAWFWWNLRENLNTYKEREKESRRGHWDTVL